MEKFNTSKNKEKLMNEGYINLSNFLSEEEFSLCKSIGEKLEIWPEEKNGPLKYFEKSKSNQQELLNRVEKIIEFFPDFENFITCKLIALLNQLTGVPYTLFKEKINFKMPGGGGFNPHQDAPAFKKFIQDEMYTVMIPLQKTNQINGCLQVSENFFKKTIIPHIDGKISEDNLNNIKWLSIEQNERDIFLFSSYLIHYSADNFSEFSRKCYFITFNPLKIGNLRETYFDYKQQSFPPRIERKNDAKYKNWQANLAREIY